MEYPHVPVDLADILSAQSIMNDPYPAFHHLRTRNPFCWDKKTGVGFITSYQDSVAVLRDQRFAAQMSVDGMLQAPAEHLAPFRSSIETMEQIVLLRENRDHARLRALFSTILGAHSVERLRPCMQATADRLLDHLIPQESMELLRDFAYPFAGGVLAHILGVPEEDHQKVIAWSCHIERLLVENPHPLPLTLRWTEEMSNLITLYRCLMEKRLIHAEDDFFQDMVVACTRGKKLSKDELVSNFVFLLFAGVPPAAQMIGKAFSLLLRHPEQAQFVRDNPSLCAPALEELLRFDGPIVHAQRFAKEDLELRGRPVQAGQCIMVCLSAANRDPSQFADPDRLDIGRERKQHLAFGHGARFCLGALLARAIVDIGLQTLLRRLPHPRLVSEQPDPLKMTRYLKELTITYK